jgi:hypothetical protein
LLISEVSGYRLHGAGGCRRGQRIAGGQRAARRVSLLVLGCEDDL